MRFPCLIDLAVLSIVLCAAAAPADAALSIYVTPEELAARSSHVVEATVTRVASGVDPATGALGTYITLDVARVLRGPTPGRAVGETLTLRELGGAIDGRVHAVDAVPVYRAGERVVAFLEPGPDGALRTTGMFFGKFVLDESVRTATRDLDGHGTIVGRPAERAETVTVADLDAVVATTERRGADRTAGEQPPEYDRVRWARPGREAPVAKFGPLSTAAPTRWSEGASGVPLVFDVERAGNPLGDGALAAFQIERALAAWTAVPESRVVLVPGNTNASFTAAHASSPASVYPPGNVVLFGDPYDDIAAPSSTSCSGVLAIGGYWRSTAGAGSANGVSFSRALRGYVIFNAGIDCFLGSPDNLAEVATHELGHALGFGHSTEFDSIMRSNAYGGRGPRLGDDDRDAVHCHYPHTLTLTAPAGGETLAADATLSVTWSTTDEAGDDPGVVRVEASFDGGAWETVADDVANDGYWPWLVPARASSNVRLRVLRPNRSGGWGAPYPAACSAAPPSAAFTITVPEPSAGSLPAMLALDKGAGATLRLSWTPSCSGDVDDHAVYSGALDALRAGSWTTLPVTCSAGADLVEYVTPAAGSRFFIVTALAGGSEGNLGSGSGRARRPTSAAACGIEESAPACR